jgi:hypothetical protein
MSVTTKGTVDGGPFRCGKHDKEFVTTDPAKWLDHLTADGEHTMSGIKPCAICHKMHEFEAEPAGESVLCDKCKSNMTKTYNKLASAAATAAGAKSKK